MEGRGGGQAQGVADPKKVQTRIFLSKFGASLQHSIQQKFANSVSLLELRQAARTLTLNFIFILIFCKNTTFQFYCLFMQQHSFNLTNFFPPKICEETISF
jgi:hypothetical protein